MVVLNRIYTRTGDDGTTALGSGERRPKHDLRISAYGTVDETNAAIGVARLHLKEMPELDAMLGRIQNDLFDLGADLAVPERERKAERLRLLSSQVERLERDIDALNAELAPLTSFVLPGGTPAAAHLHLARTICRRAERIIVELAARPDEPVGAHRKPGADGFGSLLRADRHHHNLGGLACLFQPQGFLDSDFVERIHRHLDIVQLDARSVALDADLDVVIDHALYRHQNLHRSSFVSDFGLFSRGRGT